MRLISWNIHGAVGVDRVHDPDRIVACLAALDGDVVGLQEVDWRRPPVRGLDHLALFARELNMEPVAGPNLRDHRGQFGNGLLVRGEILARRRVDLSEPGREPRGAIDADVRVRGHRLRVVVTHLGLQRFERRRQQRTLAARLLRPPPSGSRPELVTVLADLNEWLSFVRGPLVRGPCPLYVGGPTFPARAPWLSLDGVLLGPAGVRAAGGVVGDRPFRVASDHRPVACDVLEVPALVPAS
ncbi:endonuclease/exonuclease/phosphatase family protein [Thiohalocapsa halophila]|uniref:endonuclease/exonuclease/phosphatase family protein n=1 Tax=Thiohalocapsa halophila TaxID=69359 RepID=UPI001F5BD186|nr:endonuclease/exonuclease/phosphatase family protein [Thiohalocapsa halophila]